MTSETKHASAGNHRAGDDDGGIVGVIPYLVVLVCVVAGWYIAWNAGSAGGRGAVIGGVALLIAAIARLVLPARLVGLLGTRKRVTDVLTLTVLGVGLIVAGLVLPHLGSAAAGSAGRRPRRRFPAAGHRVSLRAARQVS
jgi:hypothetical protein